MVDIVRGKHGDPTVAVLGVVPGKEGPAEHGGLLGPRKATGEAGVVLQGLELRLGEWVVITDLGTAVPSNAIESLCSAIGSHLPPPYSNFKGCW